MKVLASMLVTVLLVLGMALPVSAQEISPGVVEEALDPGESITIEKTVTTAEIPPMPDIYFMSDTTGSMGPVIAAVAGNATDIMDAIALVQPDAQFGAGKYRDYPGTTPPYTNQQGITSDTTAVNSAIGAWSAGGGGDGPEGQFYALTRLADPTDPDSIEWRSGATKIVVWFGDAPAHDPVPPGATGFSDNITESTVTADLVAAGIRVVAIGTVTSWPPSPPYYPSALDDDPTKGGGNYASYYGIVEDGTSGQASRIATATGGVYLTALTPEEAVDAVIEGLEALATDVWGVVEADEGLTVTLEPVVHYDVPSGTTVTFTETITLAEDAPQCNTLEATVTFYANSYPEEGAVIGEQKISIKVNDVDGPTVWCIESVNPHGDKVPGKKASGKGKGNNPDGFYQILAEDNCDEAEAIEIYIGTEDNPMMFGPYASGVVVKITEAPGAAPEEKKIGSDKGQAGAVSYHITLPTDPVVTAVDSSGNIATCPDCLVPPPPK
jgi:hypothetical protein